MTNRYTVHCSRLYKVISNSFVLAQEEVETLSDELMSCDGFFTFSSSLIS